jgi:hypothetical protein
MPAVAVRRGLGFPSKLKPVVLGDESEAHFMARVRKLARLYGWVDWHTLDSTGTRSGEPDLRLVRPPRYILAELKSQHGRLSLPQAAAIALLEQCPGIETYVWKPSDWQDIQRVLR